VKLSSLPFSVTIVLAAPLPAAELSPAEQQRVARAAAELIEQRYVDPAKGKSVAKGLLALKWRTTMDAKAFAGDLTQWLRARSGDGHFAVDFSPTPIAEQSGETAFSAGEIERFYGAHLNHGVERIERLDGNIMLLDLRVFPPPDLAGDVFAATMTLVAQGDALIIDLRQNGGGMDTSNLLMSYLLPPGTELSGSYDRPSDKRNHATTAAWVPGRRFGAD